MSSKKSIITYDVDCMKHRKSTHLAGVDVEIIEKEKGECVLTIKNAYYKTNENVSGNLTDGYFLEFNEKVKPMVVNSTNRLTISKIIKQRLNLSSIDSRNISNWKGQKIQLKFDETIKMMGKKTGGIIVALIDPTPVISDKNALETLKISKNNEELKNNWLKLSSDERKLPSVNAFKDQLKKQFNESI